MKVDIIDEYGFDLALYGIGLSYGLTSLDSSISLLMLDITLSGS